MLRIMVLGLRGFPDVQGGPENHAEHLYPLLQQAGCRIDAMVRKRYMAARPGESWRGIRYTRLWSPKSRSLEAIVHSVLGVLVAGWRRPDILHIHAVGPALVTPLARALGLRVVVTHHGPDYEREKWGGFARWVLRTGEAWGMRLAHGRIAIARNVSELIRRKYGIAAELIPNGVAIPDLPPSTAALQRFGLTPGRYVLMVGRLVPEKRHADLIAAFAQAAPAGWKLALVGGADHPGPYSAAVAKLVSQQRDVVATGVLTGLPLSELYAHAGLFVLPSSHEGLSIALLEALSYGLPVVASDIGANREIGLPAEHYYPMGDVPALAALIRRFAGRPQPAAERTRIRAWVADRFDWQAAAARSLEVYARARRAERESLPGSGDCAPPEPGQPQAPI